MKTIEQRMKKHKSKVKQLKTFLENELNSQMEHNTLIEQFGTFIKNIEQLNAHQNKPQ